MQTPGTMPNPNNVNVYSAIAQHLANPTILSAEEQLFQDALKTVEARRKKCGKLPKFFDNLTSAKSLQDVHKLLQTEKESNAVWKEPVGKRWMENFSKFADSIWYYKVILDAVGNGSPALGGPLWGSIAFVVSVFQDIGATVELSRDVERTLTASMEQFYQYFKRNLTLSTGLLKRLSEYYEAVLDFSIDVHGEFSKSLAVTIFNTLHRTLKNTLKTFYDKIRPIITDVNTFAIDDSIQGVTNQLSVLSNDIRNRAAATAPSIQPALVPSYGLPQPSVNFVGQRQYLDALGRSLNIGKSYPAQTLQGQKRAVLYGMGGIGKTQILLKFINDQISATAQPRPYDAAIWISAASDVSIKTDILSFMEVNGFREKLEDDQGNTRYSPFHARLQHHCKHWVLIFDNVKDYDHVRKAIPQTNTGHVLFSTRDETIAEQLAPYSKPVEVLPMDIDTATSLALSLAQRSKIDEDKSNAVAQAVAEFARGLPLLIEQIIKNAILGRESVTETLERVKEKKELLKQKNRSSLHEENLSLGAMAMQNFDMLTQKYPSADALLKILIQLEPSRIPVSIFQDSKGKLSAFLDRKVTYNRGVVDSKSGNFMDRVKDSYRSTVIQRKDVVGRKDIGQRTQRFLSSLGRKKSNPSPSSDTQDQLPVDDTELSAALRRECGQGTVVGVLLENDVVLQSAILVLINLSIVRKLNDNDLWMHDLTSEVSRAILMSGSDAAASNMALTAATMVYTILPTPSRLTGSRERKCRSYLSHAIACQANLRDVGILNDCSIGPELSHIIASTMDSLGPTTYREGSIAPSDDERRANITRIVKYYRAAYQGYMAGWWRLKNGHGITDHVIFHHIYLDRLEEAVVGAYSHLRFSLDRERLGSNAPWRAIQTACKLVHLLEQDPTTMNEAIAFSRVVLKFYRLAFGINDEDTIIMRDQLCKRLSSAGRWQEAYDLTMEGFKDKVGWQTGDPNDNQQITLEKVSLNTDVALFARHLGNCCTTLSENPSLLPVEVRRLATEAAMWYEIEVRMVHSLYHEDEYYGIDCTTRYAKAYERARYPRAALYWFGKAALCALAQLIWEHEEWDDGPGRGAVKIGGEHDIQDAVATFEAAADRLLDEGDGKLGRFEDLDLDLRRFLTNVRWKIEYWRKDREMYGVWNPRKEAQDRMQREFEEREEEIRLEEEELYGKFPPLHEIVDEDKGKENLDTVHLEYTIARGHDFGSAKESSEKGGNGEALPLSMSANANVLELVSTA